jgi:hypothetical protein
MRDPGELDELTDRLHPGLNRAATVRRLNGLFREGVPPDPSPDGFLRGRLIGTTVWGPLDAAVQRVARTWMPWLGKSFDSASETGVNRFDGSARVPMRILWPSYEPVVREDGRLEAFPFRTRLAPGEVDHEVKVVKIDYDFETNPGFIIRPILDELVQVADGLYLGKVLFRWRRTFHPIGFFSLRSGR